MSLEKVYTYKVSCDKCDKAVTINSTDNDLMLYEIYDITGSDFFAVTHKFHRDCYTIFCKSCYHKYFKPKDKKITIKDLYEIKAYAIICRVGKDSRYFWVVGNKNNIDWTSIEFLFDPSDSHIYVDTSYMISDGEVHLKDCGKIDNLSDIEKIMNVEIEIINYNIKEQKRNRYGL